MINIQAYREIIEACKINNTTVVAVSKTKPVEDIRALYNLGQRDFGENYVQELVEKQKQLPLDIRWHFIGHLQTNKAKQVVGITELIHGVDSFKLLAEINKQAAKIDKICRCLLQVHIAQEETKFGLNENELDDIISRLKSEPLQHIKINGLMGMASFTDNMQQVRKEFQYLRSLQSKYNNASMRGFELSVLSMGMTADYTIAIEEGSNMIRIGSLIFGERKAD